MESNYTPIKMLKKKKKKEMCVNKQLMERELEVAIKILGKKKV